MIIRYNLLKNFFLKYDFLYNIKKVLNITNYNFNLISLIGDYENARNYLEASKKEKDAQTVLLLGQTYEKLGDYNYAASIYSNFLTKNSENVVILNRLGMCKLEGGDALSALDYFEKALALEDPSMTQVLKFNQIAAYEYLGEFEQANILMKDYLAIYPDDQDAIREYEFLKSR